MASLEIQDLLEEIRSRKLKKKLLNLWASLETRFREMPASVKYHHHYQGGLYDHTREVMEFSLRLFSLFATLFKDCDVSRDDVIFIAFVHDLDKINKYKKNGKRLSLRDPEFTWNYGRIDRNDAADIVNILGKYDIHLNDNQLNTLTFSHGGWSVDRGKMTKLATLIHSADILSLAFEKRGRDGLHV